MKETILGRRVMDFVSSSVRADMCDLFLQADARDTCDISSIYQNPSFSHYHFRYPIQSRGSTFKT